MTQKQEPVAWASDVEFNSETTFCLPKEKGKLGTAGLSIPLYTSPPQRQPLTDDEIWAVAERCEDNHFAFARAIEAKLKENT